MILRKRGTIIVGLLIFLIAVIMFYFLWDSRPGTFPSNDHLVKEMNQYFTEANIEVIQDTIYLDEWNVFVPFITENKEYGTSFWVWKDRKWHVAEVNVNDILKVWKLDNNDPSSYQFVWNFSPVEKISYMKIYLIKERMHRWNDEMHYYEPRIQMEEMIKNEGKSYGALPISKDWVTVINEINKIESNQKQEIFTHFFNTQKEYYFSWNTYDVNNQVYPLESLNNSYSWHGDTNVEVEYVFYGDVEILEYPND